MNGPRLQGRVLQLSMQLFIIFSLGEFYHENPKVNKSGLTAWISLATTFFVASHMASEQILLLRQRKAIRNGTSNTNYIDLKPKQLIVSQGMTINSQYLMFKSKPSAQVARADPIRCNFTYKQNPHT